MDSKPDQTSTQQLLWQKDLAQSRQDIFDMMTACNLDRLFGLELIRHREPSHTLRPLCFTVRRALLTLNVYTDDDEKGDPFAAAPLNLPTLPSIRTGRRPASPLPRWSARELTGRGRFASIRRMINIDVQLAFIEAHRVRLCEYAHKMLERSVRGIIWFRPHGDGDREIDDLASQYFAEADLAGCVTDLFHISECDFETQFLIRFKWGTRPDQTNAWQIRYDGTDDELIEDEYMTQAHAEGGERVAEWWRNLIPIRLREFVKIDREGMREHGTQGMLAFVEGRGVMFVPEFAVRKQERFAGSLACRLVASYDMRTQFVFCCDFDDAWVVEIPEQLR